MSTLLEGLYLPGTQQARLRLMSNVGERLVGGAITAAELELFLIYFSALGVHMTEPVEGWIRRAGERCEELGFLQLGRTLKLHSKHEANHHLMMIEDTKMLTARWNRRHAQRLDAERLLALPMTPANLAYIELHESVIESDAPYCQLAIEYEIEGLSVSLGPKLVEECRRLLGDEVLEGLSFLREHVEIDVGHTHLNTAELERLLRAHPSCAEPLKNAGSAALDAYGRFLEECLTLATEQWTDVLCAGGATESADRTV
jgi:hypothetical protein